MNIYKLINSKSVGEHLETIKYEFNSIEAAFLIWYSKKITVKEKHALWNELIETMPDCPIEKRPNTVPQNSLHEFLQKYMAVENSIVEHFYRKEDNSFYTFDFYCEGDGDWCEDNGIFINADDCVSGLKKAFEYNPDCIRLIKKYMNEQESYIKIFLNPSKEIVTVDEWGTLNDADQDIYVGVFDGFWLEFPLPFKKGDILQYSKCPYDVYAKGHLDRSAIVLEDDLLRSEYLRSICQKSGDTSDMNVYGIFCNGDGKFYHECEPTYLDFELQYEPLNDCEKGMIPLSNYLKGKISVDILCNAYHVILSELHSNNIRKYMNITNEGMTLAGLDDDKN